MKNLTKKEGFIKKIKMKDFFEFVQRIKNEWTFTVYGWNTNEIEVKVADRRYWIWIALSVLQIKMGLESV